MHNCLNTGEQPSEPAPKPDEGVLNDSENQEFGLPSSAVHIHKKYLIGLHKLYGHFFRTIHGFRIALLPYRLQLPIILLQLVRHSSPLLLPFPPTSRRATRVTPSHLKEWHRLKSSANTHPARLPMKISQLL